MIGIQLWLAGDIKKTIVFQGIVAKAEPLNGWMIGIANGRLEGGMFARKMVRNIIQNNPNASLMGFGNKELPIVYGSKARLDRTVVNRVIAMMGWAGENRG